MVDEWNAEFSNLSGCEQAVSSLDLQVPLGAKLTAEVVDGGGCVGGSSNGSGCRLSM
jgi:hypothetical protein